MSIKDKLKNEISIRLKYITTSNVIYVDTVRSVEKLKWHQPTINWSSAGSHSIESATEFLNAFKTALSEADKLKTEIDEYNRKLKED